MNAIFGYIIPGSLAMEGRRITAQFADIEGHRETLVAETAETADDLARMIKDQMKYQVCVRKGEMVLFQSETITPDTNGRTGRLNDGMVVFFPEKMDVPADTPCEAKFYGMISKGAFHAFGVRINVPEPDKTPSTDVGMH